MVVPITTERLQASVARQIGEALAVAVVYYLCGKLGLRLAYVGSNITLIWPPTGIAIAALLRLGPGCWPGIFLGATVVNAELGTPLWASLIMGAGNTAGPAFAAAVLRRADFRPFERLRDVLGFVGTALVSMTIAPTVGLLALQHAGLVPTAVLGSAWAMWWVGDLNGALIVGPVLLTLRRAALVELRGRAAELTLMGAAAVAMSILAFVLTDTPVAFAALVPIVWAALRFPGLGSSSAVLLVAAVVVWATVSGHGQFATTDVRRGLLSLSQMHQIVFNLVSNAQQAMGAAGGVMEISLSEVDVDREFAVAHGSEAGRHALLEVRDTGHGIDAATIARIFDPFFTTKQPGSGTGLGLSLVHAIVRSHGGAIAVRSAVGRGTTFSVYVPASAAAVEREESMALAAPPGGGERILLVDDEVGVLVSTGRVLERLGYAVTLAASPHAALELLANEGRKFDLLLTDLTMPEMTGIMLAVEARKRFPDLAVLIATGYGASIDATEAAAAGVREILEKPMTRDVLASAVRDALDGAIGATAPRDKRRDDELLRSAR